MAISAQPQTPHMVQERVTIIEQEGLLPNKQMRSSYEAYRILQFAFVVAPILAGADKFLHILVNWDQYLAPWVKSLLPISTHSFMLAVGGIEMLAGLLVAIKPRIGAYIVGLWLLGIVINLLTFPGYYDIALRDFGLALGAFALGRLSELYDPA